MNNPSSRATRLCKLTGIVLAILAVVMAVGGDLEAQGKDDSAVKLTATAGKVDKDGKQTITIKMKVDDGWHAHANDVQNETYQPNMTSVSIAGSKKVDVVSIDYPKGRKHTQTFDIAGKSITETLYVYDGSVDIVATVKRTANDTGPLEVTVKFATCNDKECKLQETVKLTVK